MTVQNSTAVRNAQGDAWETATGQRQARQSAGVRAGRLSNGIRS